MLKTFCKPYLFSSLLAAGLVYNTAHAEQVSTSQWLIKPGDTLYKIARTVFPGDSRKQAQFRRDIVKANPDAFRNGASNISVGVTLTLPASAQKPASTQTPQKAVAVKVAPVKATPATPTAETASPTNATQTPDPEDIVGQVVINTGSLSAENRGSSRALNRKSSIFKGDTLTTGRNSHTQLRMKDGALISLRPNTALRVEDYRYNGTEDGSERSLLELIKGGFRTITGAIGHKNKRNYKVKTTVATIGIRGTHYTLVMCQQQSCSGPDSGQVEDGLYGGVADGSIILENASGVHQFKNDQFFKLSSGNTAPVEFLQPPSVLKTGPVKIAATGTEGEVDGVRQQGAKTLNQLRASLPRRQAIILENQLPQIHQQILDVADLNTNTTPVSDILPQKAPDGSAMLIGFSYIDPETSLITGAGAPVYVTPINNNEVFLSSFLLPDGNLVQRIPVGAREFSYEPDIQAIVRHDLFMASPTGQLTATLIPSSLGGNSLGVNWGRWRGEYTVLEDGQPFNTLQDFHFIYSENLTSPNQLANLGGIVGEISYMPVGGTLPTDAAGNVGSLTSLNMTVDFSQQLITDYNVQVMISGNSYNGNATNIAFQDLQRSFSIAGSTCPSGGACAGEASIAFVGPNAEGAINSYHIEDTNGPKAATGTALMLR